jgi:nucleoside-diphosphate-sugar epimerase
MKRDENTSVLLTGASGVVGSALLDELDDVAMTCLAHRTPTGRTNVRHVTGDITQPRLGLSAFEFSRLAESTDVVVHAAAMTDFTAGDRVTSDLNVRGTAHVLELAELADASVYYVSTAFVERASQVRGGDDSCGGPRAYLQSKRAAEQLVRESGLRAALIRPSVVIGDSRSGRIAGFQGLHALAGAIIKGALPLIPLAPGSLVDFVPQDFVARAIADLVRSGECHGEYWLTAGNRALCATDMVDACVEIAAGLDLEVDAPRFIAPDAIDRLIRPVFIEPLPEQARKRFDQMLNMTALFSVDTAFESSAPELEHQFGLCLPDLRDVFLRSLEYWASCKGLIHPAVPDPLPLAA